jgi:glycerol uptake facilitator-like aquaporin
MSGAYMAAQFAGAVVGVYLAHAMFVMPILEISTKLRDGPSQWLAEFIATFGLLTTIAGSIRVSPSTTPLLVGLYISAAYWFTASTSFANPAVTVARALTNSFSGIAPASAPDFIAAQIAGALAGYALLGGLFNQRPATRVKTWSSKG